jgi:hypothetical protein
LSGSPGISTPVAGDLLQLPLDSAGAREQVPVELAELVTRRIEDESAGNPDGDSDRAPVELDCETLACH